MPVVLVLAPTRELALQIFEEGRKFSYKTGIRCAVVYGGPNMQEQRREITKGYLLILFFCFGAQGSTSNLKRKMVNYCNVHLAVYGMESIL